MISKKHWRITILTVIALALLLLTPQPVSRALRGMAGQFFGPILSAASAGGGWLHTRLTNFRQLGSLFKENELLKQRVIELEQQVTDLANAAAENEQLRAELNIANRPAPNETVAASIVSRTTNNLLGEAIINQGENAGLLSGQAVVSQGILVGRVEEVFKTTARVSLINSQNCIVQAILTDSLALGLIRGGLTGLRLTDINQDVEIREGEIVQTSGLGGVIPSGLIIGQVDRVISSPNDPRQEAVVRSPIDFDRLRLVFVVKGQPLP